MPNFKNEATPSVATLNRVFSSTKHPEIQQVPTLRNKLKGFPWRIFFITSLLPLNLAPIIILSAIAEMASQNYIRGRSCYPNGLWKEAAGATWRIMDSTYFFTPNLSFGSMTFTQVKVIDIAWDLVIGRGGQMGLAWVNWVVFNEWLMYHLERWGTSYKMFASVGLQTTSLTTLGVTGKEFLAFGERSWGRFFRWLAMFCMFISTLYVLAFPTLMAAMTGYITTYVPYMEDYDRNLIEWEKVEEVVAIVQDAERLGLGYQKPLVVIETDKEVYQAWEDYLEITSPESHWSGADGSTNFFVNSPTTWKMGNQSVDLPAPSLNVTWPLRGMPLRDLKGPVQQYYAIGGRQGTLYNSSYVKTHSSCKPSETYQWGFSYIFLFMVSSTSSGPPLWYACGSTHGARHECTKAEEDPGCCGAYWIYLLL